MPKISRIFWSASFKRAYRKHVIGTSDESLFERRIGLFIEEPFGASLFAHKLSGKLEGLWAFTISYDCRVIFKFLSESEVLLIDIGSHDEVY